MSPATNLEGRVVSLEDDRDRLLADMYFGNGKDNPSMTSRMRDIEVWQKQEKSKAEKKDSNAWQIKFLLLSLLLGQIITYLAAHHAF